MKIPKDAGQSGPQLPDGNYPAKIAIVAEGKTRSGDTVLQVTLAIRGAPKPMVYPIWLDNQKHLHNLATVTAQVGRDEFDFDEMMGTPVVALVKNVETDKGTFSRVVWITKPKAAASPAVTASPLPDVAEADLPF